MRKNGDGPTFSDREDVDLPDDAEEMGTYAANSPQIPVGRHARLLFGRIKKAITRDRDRT